MRTKGVCKSNYFNLKVIRLKIGLKSYRVYNYPLIIVPTDKIEI